MGEEIWLFAHLIVPLATAEGTEFGKAQINLAFRSFNRTFAPNI
jgi:hypothetical protein